MELLAPAGNYDAALAAINGGCDALYIGGKRFSARMSADNFSDEEMIRILSYAHFLGVKVFVTMNTLLYQDEFSSAVSYAEFLYRNGVDALIVQDLGLANYLHKAFPSLELHASTQLNCHNIAQAKALKSMGFARIVLAREANLSLVEEVKKLGLEVEVFVHGALCVCYSGCCLMSSFIGDRSGNRGRCAQPCRMKYTLCDDDGDLGDATYLISTKDLNDLNYLPLLHAAGVDSLKIEGRLKQTEYVYLVCSSYRKALDRMNGANVASEDLKRIFSREFTKGYLLGATPLEVLNQRSSSHQGERIGKVVRFKGERVSILLEKDVHRKDGIRFNDASQYGREIQKMFVGGSERERAEKGEVIEFVRMPHPVKPGCEVIRTSSWKLLNELSSSMSVKRKISVQGKVYAYIGKPLMFEIRYGSLKIRRSGEIVRAAEEKGTEKERILFQFSKVGEYPMVYRQMSFFGDESVFIPIGEINRLRNETLETFATKRCEREEEETLPYRSDCPRAEIRTDLLIAENGYIESKLHSDEKIGMLNRIEDEISVSDQKTMSHFFIEGKKLIASPYCNITNSYALDAFFEHGYVECCLSYELDRESIEHLIDDFYARHGFYPNVGYFVYDRPDVMVMRSCPVATYFGKKKIACGLCRGKRYYLKDRMGEIFPLIEDDRCITRVLSNRRLYLIDRISEMQGFHLSRFYVNFTIESREEKEKILAQAKENLDRSVDGREREDMRGHYFGRAF